MKAQRGPPEVDGSTSVPGRQDGAVVDPDPDPSTCLFCRIVAGREPAFVVLDVAEAMAFLDVRPLFPGHTLVVPRIHVEVLADLPADQLAPYFAQVQRLSRAMEDVLGAAGSFVAVNNRVSQSQPHLHTHVVPRNRKDGLRGFYWPRRRYADGEAEAVAARLRAGLERLDR